MVRRSLLLTCLLAGAALCLYSCSMQASFTTDERGQVVAVSSVRLDGSLPRVALGLLIAAKGLSLELRWSRLWQPAGGST